MSRSRPALVVLGMHRSGTSALAALLHHCGAALPRSVMPPKADNPLGFSESTVLVDLADEILAAHGMAWDSLGRIPPEWFSTGAADRWSLRYSEALAAEFPGEGPIVLKDPRLCRLVPLLSAACERAGFDARYAVSVRHPLEVARSLEARNDWSPERGVAAWLQHYLPAERDSRDSPRAFASYERLIRDWGSVAGSLEEALGVSLDPGGAAAEKLDRMISSSLRHHVHEDEASDWLERRAPWAGRGHAALLALEVGDETALARLDRLRALVEAAEDRLGPIAADLERAAIQERRERDAVQRHLAHAEEELRKTRIEQARASAALRLARQEVQREASHREEVQKHLREETSHREAVQKHLSYAERRLREFESELETILSSRSMRLTRPIRWLGRRLRGGPAPLRPHLTSLARRIFRATPMPESLRTRIRGTLRGLRERRLAELEAAGRAAERQASGLPPGDADGRAKEHVRRESERSLDEFLKRGERLDLPEPPDAPTVSVLLVLHNQADLTLACLRALRSCEFRDFEVVIVDNASTDRTREMLERVGPCRTILQEENLHFLRAVNLAADHARGRYLLLLNNDTRVAPGALGEALAVFEKEERVGAVGGRLILPDGRLQEAGSIIWSDGSCLGYGRGGDPLDPRWMFRRDVDYCSAAFLLTPRTLFDQLGRFDESFAPAYYEDTDYCLRLQIAGYRVLYEPRVVVSHFEFGSSSMVEGAQRSHRNQKLFLKKHRKRLADHVDPKPRNVLRARSALRRAPRIVHVDDRFPHRTFGSGFPRANDLLREMVEAGCEVTLFATDQPYETWEETYSDIPARVECIRGDRGAAMATFLRERRGHADMILISRPHNMAAFTKLVEEQPEVFGNQRVVYDAEALFCLREIERHAVAGEPLQRQERRERMLRELALASRADSVITVTEREARYFRLCTDAVFEVGHALESTPGPATFQERSDFLFVGAFHEDDGSPNADSMMWFAREAWPLVRRDPRLDHARLRIVGRDPSPAVRALGEIEGVDVVGSVPRTSTFYDQARVCVVPTRFAAGAPYKGHEAAAHGVPMVTTRLIARQLGWTHERELLCAASSRPDAFAHQCVRLYTDPELWSSLRRGGLQRIEEDCSAEAFRRKLLRALGLDERNLAGARPWKVAEAAEGGGTAVHRVGT